MMKLTKHKRMNLKHRLAELVIENYQLAKKFQLNERVIRDSIKALLGEDIEI